VAPTRQPARSSEPVHGAFANPLELGAIVPPDEIGILGPGRLGEVVREKRCALVLTDAAPFEPVGERRMQSASP
jgi:hypothetical protein